MRDKYLKKLSSDRYLKIFIVIISGFFAGIGLNMFLTPANVFASGVPGVAQLLAAAAERYLSLSIGAGVLIMILNLPIFILSWIKLGKTSTLYSFFVVLSMSIATTIIPVVTLVDDILLNAILGGVFIGASIALCLKYGFTTGGLDIIALALAKTTGRSVSTLIFLQNLVIIILAGLMYDWSIAIYTIISLYCLSIVVDKIHTSGKKITAFIISEKEKEIVQELTSAIPRGVTVLEGKGGYSNKKTAVIMTVVSQYEIYDLEKKVYAVDSRAFINIVPTHRVVGEFWNEEQQKEYLYKKV